ncbi:MAG: hypothetical protein JEY99_17960 [Spirochaetales bacterium]|nr:hypothetical protein [Spirochaetales bacterium]
MFGLGLSEIITLIIVVIVFLNPKDLPFIIRKIGKIYGKIMRQINGLKKTFSDFEKEVNSISDINASGKITSRKESEEHLK